MRITSYIRTALVPSAALFALVALRAAPAGPAVALGVEGRSSATPSVAAEGAFVAVAWGASASGTTDVFVAASRDGGRTFAAPVRVNAVPGEARLGGELPPRVALAPRGKAAVPAITVLWTARGGTTAIKSARSVDGGRTFDRPVALQSAGAAGDRGWPSLAIDSGGAAHAIWLDHRGLAPAAGKAGAHAAHQAGATRDGVAMAQKSGLYYASRGAAPRAERALAGGVCYCCKTALAAGPGGALYAAWRHVYPGNLRDMAFAVSRDGGRTFGEPARVSEDGWAIDGCPDDGPAMAVGEGGAVHLVWPTVIGGPEPEGALFYAVSRDGRTFTPRARIATLGSPRPSHPQIAIDRQGRVAVAWDEVIAGRRVASVRELKRRADGGVDVGAVVTLAPSPSMYPALAATDTGFVAVWATGGSPSRVGTRVFALP